VLVISILKAYEICASFLTIIRTHLYSCEYTKNRAVTKIKGSKIWGFSLSTRLGLEIRNVGARLEQQTRAFRVLFLKGEGQRRYFFLERGLFPGEIQSPNSERASVKMRGIVMSGLGQTQN
jgi:hypothetical protein